VADGVTASGQDVPGTAALSLDMPAPQWFRDAMSTPPTVTKIPVGDVNVAVHRWGGDGPPSIVLLHGAGAHSLWWAHIAPSLASEQTPVVAIDLTGHGASDRRPSYSLDAWAAELRGAVQSLGATGTAVVVGHSLGGVVGLRAASEAGHGFAGLVLVDSLVRPRGSERQTNRERIASTPTKIYPSQAAAVGAFRPFPKPDRVLPYVAAQIALSSLRAVEGGYTWRFDPRVFARPDIDALPVPLAPTAVVRPEHGLVTAQVLAEIQERIDLAGVVEVQGAGHHAMLDAPIALETAIESGVALVGPGLHGRETTYLHHR
jgi:pimeloyl-ACP methyl ester carboxylesterase